MTFGFLPCGLDLNGKLQISDPEHSISHVAIGILCSLYLGNHSSSFSCVFFKESCDRNHRLKGLTCHIVTSASFNGRRKDRMLGKSLREQKAPDLVSSQTFNPSLPCNRLPSKQPSLPRSCRNANYFLTMKRSWRMTSLPKILASRPSMRFSLLRVAGTSG